jgi:hypothetical protein
MKKHRPFPALCERCDRKIDDRTGWGVMMICSIQAQPNGHGEEREIGLRICGYCLHELALWLCPEVGEEPGG